MTRIPCLSLGLLATLALVATVLLVGNVSATSDEYKALIVVSSFQGTSQNELNKAIAFYDHLMEKGYGDDDILFLCTQEMTIKDGDPTAHSVEEGFEWLIKNSQEHTEVNIYISDNSHASEMELYYQFYDGTVNCFDIVDWVNEISYSTLNYITLGNHSGLFGRQLVGPNRVVMSSMRDFEEADTDQFNITRGLLDPLADYNNDGKVSMVEAFWSEYITLLPEPQTPVLWFPRSFGG